MVSEVSLHMKSVNAYTTLVQLVESVKIGHGTIYQDIVRRLMTIVSAEVIALGLIGSTVLIFFVSGALLYLGVMKLCQLEHSTDFQPTKGIASYPFSFKPIIPLDLHPRWRSISSPVREKTSRLDANRQFVLPDRAVLQERERELMVEKENLLNWLREQDPEEVSYQRNESLLREDKRLSAEIDAIQLQLREYRDH